MVSKQVRDWRDRVTESMGLPPGTPWGEVWAEEHRRRTVVRAARARAERGEAFRGDIEALGRRIAEHGARVRALCGRIAEARRRPGTRRRGPGAEGVNTRRQKDVRACF